MLGILVLALLAGGADDQPMRSSTRPDAGSVRRDSRVVRPFRETGIAAVPYIARAGIGVPFRHRWVPMPTWQEQKTGGGWILVGALVGAVVGLYLSVDCDGCMAPSPVLIGAGALIGAIIVINML